ncbi:hypothetical protein NTGHW29_830015 [Candidatus Nitrotoga sp. HW29]|nr:hypothetical protein NTGHW29_830015 [Candidatus Nitrotoga sp. HW29]
MGSSLKARLKALSKDDSSTKQTGLVIAPFVSKEEQSCIKALVQLVRSSKSTQKEDLLLPPSGALPLVF